MFKSLKKKWEVDYLNFRLFILFIVVSLIWVIVAFIINGFIVGLGAIIILTALFILSARTFLEPKYYVFAFAVLVIFTYDTLLMVNNNLSLAVTIGIIAIHVIITLWATMMIVLRVLEFSKECTYKALIVPINFIVLGFYTIICAGMTNITLTSNEFIYGFSDNFPYALFGLFFLQLGFMFYSRHYHIKCVRDCPKKEQIIKKMKKSLEEK